MQRKDAQKLSELLPQILADQQLDRRLDEKRLPAIRRRYMSGRECCMSLYLRLFCAMSC